MEMKQIYYVPQLAEALGKTEAAIRAAVNRGADWLPPSFQMGRRLAWLKEDVDKFLADKAKQTRR